MHRLGSEDPHRRMQNLLNQHSQVVEAGAVGLKLRRDYFSTHLQVFSAFKFSLSLSMFTKSLGPCIILELASCILNFAFFTLHLHFGSDCLTIVEVHYLIVKMKATYWAHSGAIGSSEVFLVICHPYLISEDCLGAHFVLIS